MYQGNGETKGAKPYLKAKNQPNMKHETCKDEEKHIKHNQPLISQGKEKHIK